MLALLSEAITETQPEKLYEAPFTDFNPNGLDGVFDDSDASGIVSILDAIRRNAAA